MRYFVELLELLLGLGHDRTLFQLLDVQVDLGQFQAVAFATENNK